MDPLTCPFCNPSKKVVVLANSLCYARYDRYPVSPGHLLLIPFRHIPTLFDATNEEQAALLALVREAKALLDGRIHPDGHEQRAGRRQKVFCGGKGMIRQGDGAQANHRRSEAIPERSQK